MEPNSTTHIETPRIAALRLNDRPATIAVLGLGTLGTLMALELKRTGHNVVVYDKEAGLCFKFISEGAKIASTVREAFDMADVTFGCVDCEMDAAEIFEGMFSILCSNSISKGKGYVEMMGVAEDLSKQHYELVKKRGGLYLEAQVHAFNFHAAGDLELFEMIKPCFYALDVRSCHWYNRIGAAALFPLRKPGSLLARRLFMC